ncbi:MAG: hypothetical protein G01um101448_858 [Parcubacteria group bacterium Gr01-1014_48]|nr:MAG: hypothetical protein Greene041614_1014 [Parcubacteria group bacterium Greene0416_14]TSC73220.1 MAG: hypothetical protein G01um101448_858 [Parcubacteria group bacterium Gr01-1014_48]TSD00484.1 MAG: hypothetical protein Greene101415_833 [Parcubacteria group bacterium Greene1014_15]TSD08381.1 MAG: hypothetical protein Greene07144_97 [Parcubacteria group bacterium Greene0714_4]
MNHPPFDFERSVVLTYITSSRDRDDYYLIQNLSWGPCLVPKKNLHCLVIPELGKHTGKVLVDITGRGSKAHAVIAAEVDWKIANMLRRGNIDCTIFGFVPIGDGIDDT